MNWLLESMSSIEMDITLTSKTLKENSDDFTFKIDAPFVEAQILIMFLEKGLLIFYGIIIRWIFILRDF